MTRGSRTLRPLIADLDGLTVRDALEAATQLWATEKLHPGDPSELLSIAADIHRWATDNQITLLSELTGDVAAAMLRELVGIKTLDGPHKPKTTERLHKTRNTLIALRGTLLITRQETPRKRGNRPAGDSLAAGLPAVPARSQQRGRPLRDDEILLARLLVKINLTENAPALPTMAYLFAESGVATAASTKLERDHLDHPLTPRKITVQGLWKPIPRDVKLSRYTTDTLATILPTLRVGNQPLTYSGSETGRAPSATLNCVLTRFLTRAGVSGADITAKSLTLWRPDHLLRRGNVKKALRIHGKGSKNLLNDLRYTKDETNLYENQAIIRDANNKIVAKVNSQHLEAA